MKNQAILLSLLASLTAAGCQQVECADGTIERDGNCYPAEASTSEAKCGPFTELIGDKCQPMFPPTQCDPSTTASETDENGVTTCIGMGGGTCTGPFACATPTGSTKQTVCGQIYDVETGMPYSSNTGGQVVVCNPAMPTATGPCALQMVAYDALRFGMNPTTEQPLTVGSVYIDDCGRFRVVDIETNGTGPFLGIGLDDAGMPLGPGGTVVTGAIATGKVAGTATKDVEAFAVRPATVAMWAANGPPLSGGIYMPIFRQHKTGNPLDVYPFPNQTGVTVTKNGNTVPTNDFYFTASQTTRQTIDAAATSTGMNGTALVTGASVTDSLAWAGQGGLGAGCRWEPRAGASLPGIVFVSVFKKIDILGMTCND
jgi:hypothetical protein